MTLNGSDLLRQLGSAGGPSGTRPVQAADPRLIEGPDFASMLDRAREGGLSTGIPVRVDRGAGVDLTPDQLARLADAADRAEAQGAARALVLIDGRALTMDVGLRTITGSIDPARPQTLTGLDAVVTVPPADGAPPGPLGRAPFDQVPPVGILPAGPAGLNPSLLRALERPADRA